MMKSNAYNKGLSLQFARAARPRRCYSAPHQNCGDRPFLFGGLSMHRRVWIFRHRKELEEKGEDASWYVGFYDDAGKRKKESWGSGLRGLNKAQRRVRQLEGQLEAG